MHLHLNPLGGLSGDMFCAALLDAFPDRLAVAERALAAVPMPRNVRVGLTPAAGPLSGKRFRVVPVSAEPERHTPYREIRTLLQGSGLEAGVRDRALAIFRLLAEAEARIHGKDPDEVELHEVGAWDSIADILSAAALLDALGVTGASSSPLPLGAGQVPCAHGPLPVPAPATALLLEGLAVSYDGIEGERVTPTGAAILRSLGPRPTVPAGARLQASGRGFGARRLAGVPNCLQVLCLEVAEGAAAFATDRVELLRFEVDDQTPEDLAIGLDRLRAAEGVLSVTTFPGTGKKGRPTMAVEVISRPERLGGVADACFRETTTIGLRRQSIDRMVLARDQREVRVSGGAIGVKLSNRPQGPTAKAESTDLAEVASHQARERLRREAEAAALEEAGASGSETGHG